MPENWTDEEISAAVKAYLEMLRKELSEQPVNKSNVNDRLRQGPLKSRSHKAVEFRMRNISHVLDGEGLPWIQGYLPGANVGQRLAKQIWQTVQTLGGDVISSYGPTADIEALEVRARRLANAPRPIQGNAPAKTDVTVSVFKRDARVVAWVRAQAGGICELCDEAGPFLKDGEPFLEVHHVVPLADGGFDSVENAVAICPNCHRRLHLSDEGTTPTQMLYERVARLDRPPPAF